MKNFSKSSARLKLNDLWLRVAGIPVIAAVGTYMFYSEDCSRYDVGVGRAFFIALLNTILIWELCRQVLIKCRRLYPGVPLTLRRNLCSLAGYTGVVILVVAFSSFIYNITGIWNHQIDFRDSFFRFQVDMLFVAIVGGTYEALYFFREWEHSIKEAEQLKKIHLQSQLDALKNQVNPHFLFNSLNSLSSLIAEDQEKATKFVDELSSVYRYLLLSNDRELTSLDNELQFTRAYFYLLKTRFGEGVNLNMMVDPGYSDYCLPPLTLQILIENAVKHNSLSVTSPLQIDLYTCSTGKLVVENNLQKRLQKVPSNRMGLTNISSKYSLLGFPAPEICESAGRFTVTLPLIKN